MDQETTTAPDWREIALHLLMTALPTERERFAITHTRRRTPLTDDQKRKLKELRTVIDEIASEGLATWLATRGKST
jgi:DNA-binding IclR family transcriptional regulator